MAGLLVGPRALGDALKLGSSDLRFTLSRNDVPDEVQAHFFENGVTNVNKFSSFFRSEEDLIQVLRDDFNIDASASLADRAQVASVICSWKETITKAKRQAEVEAEMDSREWTKPIPVGDYVQLRNFFQKTIGHIEDRVTPAKEYLEKKLQELENGEFRAETLAEVVSKDEIDPDVLVPIFDSKGSLSVKKGSSQVPMPTGPEQLRRRLSVMQNCLMMLALKHVNREEIQDVSKDVFDKYKDYLLGDYVWGLSSTDLQGQQIQTPPWSLVLAYEQSIRKRAYNLMTTEKLMLGAALEKAWKCYPISQPEGWKLHGGHGEARKCEVPGKSRMFHDGCGLASPGRWDIEDRIWNDDGFWKRLRSDSYQLVLQFCGGQQNFDRTCFEMAAKGEAGCNLVQNQELKDGLVDLWRNMLQQEGYNTAGLADIAEGQPFRLRLMEALLDRAGDPDHRFLLQGEKGYPVGVLQPLPRTPHMYEEQTSWKLEDDPYMRSEIWRDNYESVGDHEILFESILRKNAKRASWKG
ncbi:unnamed protein product [Cladocopium goreaui]|uniref:Reverse transcriptase domain-containing protein n=1 Tax=Cladocopium goreaui TaxID=2562237 RepID=A0A9P1BHE8_9DINO|nr:unnamed protein product [Cladocopium goreaui]